MSNYCETQAILGHFAMCIDCMDVSLPVIATLRVTNHHISSVCIEQGCRFEVRVEIFRGLT